MLYHNAWVIKVSEMCGFMKGGGIGRFLRKVAMVLYPT
jgi:hypothetical protein